MKKNLAREKEILAVLSEIEATNANQVD